ncbi:hypothetical protein TNCV_446131 [Trichonephila clavipes]|nr:hypothetical protein TNCV_446131 [Trichonephila clavipes]
MARKTMSCGKMAMPAPIPKPSLTMRMKNHFRNLILKVAAIHRISHSCLDPNDFTLLNCIVKGYASLSPPSLRLRLCSRFTLLAT